MSELDPIDVREQCRREGHDLREEPSTGVLIPICRRCGLDLETLNICPICGDPIEDDEPKVSFTEGDVHEDCEFRSRR